VNNAAKDYTNQTKLHTKRNNCLKKTWWGDSCN